LLNVKLVVHIVTTVSERVNYWNSQHTAVLNFNGKLLQSQISAYSDKNFCAHTTFSAHCNKHHQNSVTAITWK